MSRDDEREVRCLENVWIPLADGCRLAARIWLPVDAPARPVPAILEYLPYRKRDGTARRDELTHPWLAAQGFAGVRVDLRGCGESDGLMLDEYTPRELADALCVIAWLSGRPWCNGAVGMMGISWGGFNALQVSALAPEPLKAIVTVCSTDDRYGDDIHYKGGCLINENLGWGAVMASFSSRPPDPALVGERWRDMWLNRLAGEPFFAAKWLSHPTRDEYWKHGSVCENYAAIKAAVLAVGGWNDAYTNAIPRLMENLSSPGRAIIGPWAHTYPHIGVPGPKIDFLHESLRWWNYWLKGVDTGVLDEPRYRVYQVDPVRADDRGDCLPGRWLGLERWPTKGDEMALFEGRDRQLTRQLNNFGNNPPVAVISPQHLGAGGGEYCIMWLGPEFPADQNEDDAMSATFDSEPLVGDLEIIGACELDIEVSVDRANAHLICRLNDIFPDGAASRITYGVLNLAHRHGHDRPRPLDPGAAYRVRLRLDDIAWRAPAGHRLRLALSGTYWPLVWPAPEMVKLQVHSCSLRIPLAGRRVVGQPVFRAPETAAGSPTTMVRPPHHRRISRFDRDRGVSRLEIVDDFGATRFDAHGLCVAASVREVYEIDPDDPLSAIAEITWNQQLARGDWQVGTTAFSTMTGDATHFHLRAVVDAFEGRRKVHRKVWRRRVERQR